MAGTTTCSHYPSSQTLRVVLPLPPEASCEEFENVLYERFMRHLRQVPCSRMEIKILSAIRFAACLSETSDAHVARILVDLGLRAPRAAFPADFLSFSDRCLARDGWEVGGPNAALLALATHWERTEPGPSRSGGVRSRYSSRRQTAFPAGNETDRVLS